MAPATEQISKAEVALYDRQIRLWGMEGQARLRQGSVYVIGVKALTLEVCKNLVLSGIGNLTVSDDSTVNERDLELQYYMTEKDIGRRRDEALAEKLRVLNPLVKIHTGDGITSGVPDVVVSIGQPNMVDRSMTKSKYVLADAVGLYGYIFIDCLDGYAYVEETKIDNDVVRKEMTATYKDLEESLNCVLPDSSASIQRLKRKYSPLTFIFQAIVSVEKQNNYSKDAAKKTLKQRGLPQGLVDEELADKVMKGHGIEFMPCVAVMGGTLTQEILKIVTRKEMPANNWLVYNSTISDASVCQL